MVSIKTATFRISEENSGSFRIECPETGFKVVAPKNARGQAFVSMAALTVGDQDHVVMSKPLLELIKQAKNDPDLYDKIIAVQEAMQALQE